MAEKEKPKDVTVVEVTTQTAPAVQENDKILSLEETLAGMWNDIKEIKKSVA